MTCPVFASYQRRLSASVTTPSWTIRFPERSSGSASPRFSRHSRIRAASSLPMMIRASEPPMKERLLDNPATTVRPDRFVILRFSAWVIALSFDLG